MLPNNYFNLTNLCLKYERNVDDIISVLKILYFNGNSKIILNDLEDHPYDDETIEIYKMKDLFCKKKYFHLIMTMMDRDYREKSDNLMKWSTKLSEGGINIFEETRSRYVEYKNKTRYGMILTPMENNTYKVNFEQFKNEKEYFCVGIKNGASLKNLIDINSKIHNLDYFRKINSSIYEIYDLDRFKDLCDRLIRHKKAKIFDVDESIACFMKNHDRNDKNFIPFMFEFYCSKLLNIPIYKYETMEKFHMGRADMGADLFSIDKKTIVQCKCYIKSVLKAESLRKFFEMTKRFISYRKILVVNEKCEINNDIDLTGIELIRVKDKDFDEFLSKYDLKIDRETKTIKKRSTKLPTPTIISNNEEAIYNVCGNISFATTLETHGIYRTFDEIGIKMIMPCSYIDSSVFTKNCLGIDTRIVENYLKSHRFYLQLMMNDETLQKHESVYINMNENNFEIGNSFVFNESNISCIRKEKSYVVAVSNSIEAKEELIAHYISSGFIFNGKTFEYKRTGNPINIFKNFVKPYKLDVNFKESKLIKFFKSNKGDMKMYIHPSVGKIFAENLLNDKNKIENIKSYIDKIYSINLPDREIIYDVRASMNFYMREYDENILLQSVKNKYVEMFILLSKFVKKIGLQNDVSDILIRLTNDRNINEKINVPPILRPANGRILVHPSFVRKILRFMIERIDSINEVVIFPEEYIKELFE